ncbi:MAG: YjbQ family protein [Methylococcales bacterium]
MALRMLGGYPGMPAHIKSSLPGSQITVPVSSGRLLLGACRN